MYDEFLRLLRAVEAGRRCEGKECLAVTDANVAQAEELELLKKTHSSEHNGADGWIGACPGCEEVRQSEIALRETLHAQGVDLPVDVMAPS